MHVITIYGRVNSPAFHKAMAISEACESPDEFVVVPMFPAPFDQLLGQLRSQYGGAAWQHSAGVAVVSEYHGFIGDDAGLLRWLLRAGVAGAAASIHNSSGRTQSWEAVAEKAYAEFIAASGLTFAFVELSMDDIVMGRLVFQLLADAAPKTCENFVALCKGGYVGTPIHRIKRGGWIQGGDVVTGNGDGGESSFGGPLADESFELDHASAGVLGMANVGPHTATSQFYVTLGPCPSFDKNYVAFGQLIDGAKLLEYVETLDTTNDRPRANLRISAAGPGLGLEESTGVADELAATKLQAMTRSRNARKEIKEQQAAAAKLQAVKRGQAARKQKVAEGKAATRVQAMQRGKRSRRNRKKEAPIAE